jgi:cell division protein FtsB
VSISAGFTPAEIRELVVEYQLLPYGQKGSWLAAQGVSNRQFRRWQATVFDGDLDRGLIPRESGGMTVPPAKRRALAKAGAAQQDRDEAELARLRARVRELEATNEALGKAIGLLHERNVPESDAAPTTTDLDDSSPSKTGSSSG